MIVGILSDTHGDRDAARQAIALLAAHGAQVFFHCGDVGGERVLDEFIQRRLHFVWGNCDDPTPSLRRYVVETLGLALPREPLRVELAGRRIAVYHGHEREFAPAVRAPDYDYLFYGHTHVADDQRDNGARFINPGALHRARVKTVATLDLATDELIYRTLDGAIVQVPCRPPRVA